MLPKEERKGSPNVVGKTPEIRRQKRIKGELEEILLNEFKRNGLRGEKRLTDSAWIFENDQIEGGETPDEIEGETADMSLLEKIFHTLAANSKDRVQKVVTVGLFVSELALVLTDEKLKFDKAESMKNCIYANLEEMEGLMKRMENMKMECPLKFSKSNRVLIRPVSAMEFSNGLYSIYIGIDAQRPKSIATNIRMEEKQIGQRRSATPIIGADLVAFGISSLTQGILIEIKRKESYKKSEVRYALGKLPITPLLKSLVPAPNASPDLFSSFFIKVPVIDSLHFRDPDNLKYMKGHVEFEINCELTQIFWDKFIKDICLSLRNDSHEIIQKLNNQEKAINSYISKFENIKFSPKHGYYDVEELKRNQLLNADGVGFDKNAKPDDRKGKCDVCCLIF